MWRRERVLRLEDGKRVCRDAETIGGCRASAAAPVHPQGSCGFLRWGKAWRNHHDRACLHRGAAPIVRICAIVTSANKDDDGHEDGARHDGLRRYPRRGAMTCAETGGASKGRPKKRTPA